MIADPAVTDKYQAGTNAAWLHTMSNSKSFAVIGLVVLSFAACDKNADATAHAEPVAQNGTSAQRVVAVDVGDQGFKPSQVEAKKGERTTLRFTRTSDKTCATKVVFPEIKLEKALPLNKPVDVVVPTNESRTLAFQCGMGMFKSSVVIH